MKRWALVAVLLSGCITHAYRHYDFTKDQAKTTAVGSPMVTWMESNENGFGPVTAGFEQTLTYSGRQGTAIKVVYREAQSGPQGFGMMARPAFNQDLTYDLAESDVIAFRSTKIRVIKADGAGITFAVIESPSLAEPSGTVVTKKSPASVP